MMKYIFVHLNDEDFLPTRLRVSAVGSIINHGVLAWLGLLEPVRERCDWGYLIIPIRPHLLTVNVKKKTTTKNKKHHESN